MQQQIDIEALIRSVPDFPKSGVMFRDITTLLKNPDALEAVIDGFASAYHGRPIDKIAAIESRGFIVGAALAYRMNAGFVPIRKGGKLPAENFGQDYELEYGVDRLEMHRDAMGNGERVLLVDVLIATGGTAEAALKLVGVGRRLRVHRRPDRPGRPRAAREDGASRAGAVPIFRSLRSHDDEYATSFDRRPATYVCEDARQRLLHSSQPRQPR